MELNERNIKLASCVVIGVPLVYWIYYRFFNRISKLNLPGPILSPFLGDVLDFRRHKYQLHLLLDEYFKKYGKVFAFYHQGQPVVTVADEKIIHEILWKDFEHFPHRKFFITLPTPCHNTITMAEGRKAKMIRNLLKTLLDSSSIKNMAEHMKSCVKSTDNLWNQAIYEGQNIDAISMAQGYVMETLTKVGFSLDTPNQSEINKSLVEMSSAFTRPPFWINLIAALPMGRHLIRYIPGAYKTQLSALKEVAEGLVKERRKNKDSPKKDVLGALLAAQDNSEDLLDSDVLGQGIVLLTAVHVATSTTIGIASYFIAKHQHVQENIREEIDGMLRGVHNTDEFPTMEHIAKLKYLDAVIKEVLRLYPSGFMLMRECKDDIVVQSIQFKKGDAVLIPTYSIHRNEDIYKDPDVFNPDRFSGKMPSGSQYHPFGDGLRMCIGKQMALAEMKFYFAKLLSKYHIALSDKDQTLKVSSHLTIQAMMVVDEPINLQVTSRVRRPASPC